MMKGTMTRTKGLSSAAPERKEGERSEPDWSEGAAACAPDPPEGPCAPVRLAEAPNPEVVEKPVRRRFTAEYKRAILKEADRCSAGEIGALLRREGLYSSHLTSWRRQRDLGELEALSPKKRGRKAKPIARWPRRTNASNGGCIPWSGGWPRPSSSSMFKKKLLGSWRSP